MDHGSLFLFIPVIAILGAFGTSIIKTIIRSAERRHEMSLAARTNPIQSSNSELSALRSELTAYKDASTQYDVSLDHVLQRIEQRLDRLERMANINEASRAGITDMDARPPAYMPPAGVQDDNQVPMVGRPNL
jgi:hypothetical protein